MYVEEKKFFFKAIENYIKKTFLPCKLRQNLDFFLSETTFSKQFSPKFLLLCFLCLASGWNTKKLLKTEHQCSFVYIMNFTNVCPFWGILSALQPSF